MWLPLFKYCAGSYADDRKLMRIRCSSQPLLSLVREWILQFKFRHESLRKNFASTFHTVPEVIRSYSTAVD